MFSKTATMQHDKKTKACMAAQCTVPQGLIPLKNKNCMDQQQDFCFKIKFEV